MTINRALERRVARLEVAAAPFGQIPIWCDRGGAPNVIRIRFVSPGDPL